MMSILHATALKRTATENLAIKGSLLLRANHIFMIHNLEYTSELTSAEWIS
jgi:hypothetical protein